jgi:hypothetical protein
LIEGNNFSNNGGNPIHHEDYEDNDFSLHFDDWIIYEEIVFLVEPESVFERLEIRNNVGYPRKIQEHKIKKEVIEQEFSDYSEKSNEPNKIFYTIEKILLKLGFASIIALVLSLIIVIIIFKYHKGLGITLIGIVLLFIVIILFLKISNYGQDKQLMYLDDKDRISVEEYEKAMSEFCKIKFSNEMITQAQKSHFGANHPGTQNYEDMVSSGVFWERVFISTLKPEKYSKEILDEYIMELDMKVMKAQKHGIQFVGDIIFAGPIENLTLFSDILLRIVERYDGDGVADMPCLKYPIKYYMIGNEVSAKEFFDGTEKQYLSILKESHKTIKEAYPEAIIVQAGMVSGPNNPYWDNLLDMGASEYFDIANIHEVASQESIMKIYSFDEYIKNNSMGNKEKWVTEIQFEDTQKSPSLDTEDYAEIMAKYLIYALAHEYEKLFIVNFKFPITQDNIIDYAGLPPFGDSSAMINSSNKKTPVYEAVKSVSSTLDNFLQVEILFEDINKGLNEKNQFNIISKSGVYKFIVDDGEIYVFWGDVKLSDYLSGTYSIKNIYDETFIKNAKDVKLTDSPIFVFNKT